MNKGNFKDFFIKRTYDTEFIGLLKLKDNKEKPVKDIIVDETSKKDCLKTSCAVEILALYNEYHCTSIDSKSRRDEPIDLLEKPSFFEELRRLNTFDKILLNEKLAKTLSKNALKTVEANFSINRMIDDEYTDLVGLSK